MKCLDLILRIANPASIAGPSRGDVKGNELIRRKPIWEARGAVEGEIPIWERIQKGTLFGTFTCSDECSHSSRSSWLTT